VDYDKDTDWNEWNMAAKRRILMEATTISSTRMAPYFVEQNMAGSAATYVSSLASNMASASYQNGGGDSTITPRLTSAETSIAHHTSTVECSKETTIQRGMVSNEQSNPRLNTSQDTQTVKGVGGVGGRGVSQEVKSGFKSLEAMNKINNVTFDSVDWVTGNDPHRMENMINSIVRPGTDKAEETDGRLQEGEIREKVNDDIENVLA
jgi:hypothetical protein